MNVDYESSLSYSSDHFGMMLFFGPDIVFAVCGISTSSSSPPPPTQDPGWSAVLLAT